MDQETVFFHFFMFVFGCCIYALARVWRLSGCIKENECTTNGCTDTGKRGLHDTGSAAKGYIDAVLAVEDKRFYKHPGIDPLAICRALYNDIRAGSYVEGGSTITQQLAKNQFFTQDKKISRKVAEMFMAFEIEKVYDKDTILELYLNSIYFGNGYNSVAEACRGYFGKEPMEMNFDECTMLAGIPNAPSAYNPLVNPDLAYQRQQQVIRKMEKAGFLNK